MAPPTAPPTPTPATTRVKQSFLAILLLLLRPHLSSPPHALASTPALLILLHQRRWAVRSSCSEEEENGTLKLLAKRKTENDRTQHKHNHQSACDTSEHGSGELHESSSDGVGALIFPCNKEGRRGPCALETWMDETLHNLNNEDRIKWMKH